MWNNSTIRLTHTDKEMASTTTSRKNVAPAGRASKGLSLSEAAARDARFRAAMKRMEDETRSVFDAAKSAEKLTAKDYAIRINAKA
jgi:hypothetical protein